MRLYNSNETISDNLVYQGLQGQRVSEYNFVEAYDIHEDNIVAIAKEQSVKFFRLACYPNNNRLAKYGIKEQLQGHSDLDCDGKYFVSIEHRYMSSYFFNVQTQTWMDFQSDNIGIENYAIVLDKDGGSYPKYVTKMIGEVPMAFSLNDYFFLKKDRSTYVQFPLSQNRSCMVLAHKDDRRLYRSAISSETFMSNSLCDLLDVEYKTLYLFSQGQEVSIKIPNREFYTFSREHVQFIIFDENDVVVDVVSDMLEIKSFNNKLYINRNHAIQGGLISTICPHCQNEVSDEHDYDVCEYINFKPRDFMFGYGSDMERNFIHLGSQEHLNHKWIIGVEIEKQTKRGAYVNHVKLLQKYGFAKEYDCSVCDTNDTHYPPRMNNKNKYGYEVVSPMYPLFSDDLYTTMKAINEDEEFKGIFDRSEWGSEKIGGHMHLSRTFTKGWDLTRAYVRGYLPLIYAMYPKRIENNYCKARDFDTLINNVGEKYQAIHIMQDRIEFRIFPEIFTPEDALFRMKLIRHIVMNPTPSFIEVINEGMQEGSDLRNLLLESYSEQKVNMKLAKAFEMAKRFDTSIFNNTSNTILEELRERIGA